MSSIYLIMFLKWTFDVSMTSCNSITQKGPSNKSAPHASPLTQLRSPSTVNLLAVLYRFSGFDWLLSVSQVRVRLCGTRIVPLIDGRLIDCVDDTSLLVSVYFTSLVGLEVRESAGVKGVPLEFPERHTTHPWDPRTWLRNPVRDPLLWLSSCPPPFSTSCVGSGTRSWCVSRWGWGWARAPRGAGGRCTCWRETLSRARAVALWCKLSACACSPRPLPCKGLKQNYRSYI